MKIEGNFDEKGGKFMNFVQIGGNLQYASLGMDAPGSKQGKPTCIKLCIISIGPTVFRGPRELSSRTAEFGFLPRNLSRGISPRNSSFPRNLTFFIQTPIFSQKMTSK